MHSSDSFSRRWDSTARSSNVLQRNWWCWTRRDDTKQLIECLSQLCFRPWQQAQSNSFGINTKCRSQSCPARNHNFTLHPHQTSKEPELQATTRWASVGDVMDPAAAASRLKAWARSGLMAGEKEPAQCRQSTGGPNFPRSAAARACRHQLPDTQRCLRSNGRVEETRRGQRRWHDVGVGVFSTGNT